MDAAGDFTGQLLEQVAEHGFLAPATVASTLALQERLLLLALERLGGEMYLHDLAAELTEMPGHELAGELLEDGTFVVRRQEVR